MEIQPDWIQTAINPREEEKGLRLRCIVYHSCLTVTHLKKKHTRITDQAVSVNLRQH